MKCKKCGHNNKKNSQYCIACGEPLEEKSGGSKVIYILLVIIILLVVTISFLSINSSLHNNGPVTNITNDSQSESVENISKNNEDNLTQVTQSTPKTINDQSSKVIKIYGVPFTVPEEGNYRTECTYQFKFKGNLCEVEEVEHYETSDSERSFSTWNPSKDYSGGEGYVLTVNNHVWKGIKIEKDNRWYHISMQSNNDEEVLEMLDWMYEKNTWVGN